MKDMSHSHYALQNLGLAINQLTIGEGDIKSRFRSIFGTIGAIQTNDFPEKLEQDWESIFNRLTERKSKYKGTEYDVGSFEATMHLMRKKTASKIANDIVNLHNCLEYFIYDEN